MLVWLIPTLEKFPRGQRFLLGDRIQTTALDVLDGLIEATYSREARHDPGAGEYALEKPRHPIRLANATHCLDLQRYEFADRPGDGSAGWINTGGVAEASPA